MQIQKDEIRKTILKIAREEFIEKGFKGASMRTISQKTGVGLSNIYNYFRNKDEIFREILSPVINILSGILETHNNEEHLDINIFKSEEYIGRFTMLYVDIITKYRDELILLLLKSNGSELEKFQEEHIRKHTKVELEYLRLMKVKYPELSNDLSEFFVHTMCAWMISTIKELLMHNLKRQEQERFIAEYMQYSVGGWKRLLKVKDNLLQNTNK